MDPIAEGEGLDDRDHAPEPPGFDGQAEAEPPIPIQLLLHGIVNFHKQRGRRPVDFQLSTFFRCRYNFSLQTDKVSASSREITITKYHVKLMILVITKSRDVIP